MNIRICTDSSSDITLAELQAYNISLIPMPLLIDGKTQLDDKTRPVSDFWQSLISGASVKTSQPSPESFRVLFEEAKEKGEALIAIIMSSGISGTFQCAQLARSMVEYEHIYLIDAKGAAATAAEKLLAFHACALRDQGTMTAAEITDSVRALIPRLRMFACLDTLKYLAEGGRISKTVAQIGNIANVKPIITFTPEGTIHVYKKVIGLQRSMREMCQEVTSHVIDPAFPIIPLAADTPDNAHKFIGHLRRMGFELPIEAPMSIGATIGTYIGPGAYGIVFVEKE